MARKTSEFSHPITRRDFLKIAGAGAASLVLPGCLATPTSEPTPIPTKTSTQTATATTTITDIPRPTGTATATATATSTKTATATATSTATRTATLPPTETPTPTDVPTPQPVRLKMPWADKTGNDFWFNFSDVSAQKSQEIVRSIYGSFEPKKSLGLVYADHYETEDIERLGREDICVAGFKYSRYGKGSGYRIIWKGQIYNAEIVSVDSNTSIRISNGKEVIPMTIKSEDGNVKSVQIAADSPVFINIASYCRTTPWFMYSHYGEVAHTVYPGMFKPGMVIGLQGGNSVKNYFDGQQKSPYIEQGGVTLYVFSNYDEMQLVGPQK